MGGVRVLRRAVAVCALATLAVACGGDAPAPVRPLPPDALATVIVISLDGTTPEAVRAAGLETLGALARRGAAAERLVPVFPTNTFPNHATLVTGVAPEVHGIVGNVFRDPERGLFRYDGDPTWYEVEPLWALADRHGVVSASFHWVGSEGPWRNGHGPRHWERFDAGTPETEKVARILAWLDLPDAAERPRLVTAWFHGADHAGHLSGPGSDAVREALRGQDRALGALVSGLDARGAFASTTLFVLSDHGMLRVERSLDLAAALDAAGIEAEVLGGGGFATVGVAEGGAAVARAVEVARGLGLEAYARADAPAALRCGNPRFGDVVVLPPPGTVVSRASLLRPEMRGAHGYPPDVAGMGALFVAAGRGVAPGARLGEVAARDVAPTVLALLGIPVPDWMEGRPLRMDRREPDETSGPPPARPRDPR